MNQFTQRELLYLEDFLKTEQLAYKSMGFLADQCTDQAVKQLCQNCAQTHKQNYQTMVKHLSSGTLQ
ncbi:MAG: hypothetical protein NUK65_08535 [Firmicutes bacterium]|nr:hypothetical protein [Bacillota bacterium]